MRLVCVPRSPKRNPRASHSVIAEGIGVSGIFNVGAIGYLDTMPAMLPAYILTYYGRNINQYIVAGKFAGDIDTCLKDGVKSLAMSALPAGRAVKWACMLRLPATKSGSRGGSRVGWRRNRSAGSRRPTGIPWSAGRSISGCSASNGPRRHQALEFVRRQIEGLRHDVTNTIGSIPLRVEDARPIHNRDNASHVYNRAAALIK